MAGSITVSAAILFPFVIAFLNTLNTPTSNCNSKNDNNHGKDNKEYNQNRISKQNNSNSNINSNYSEASFLALGQAATAGAMLFLISTAPNLIAKATVEEFIPGKTISFTDWLTSGSNWPLGFLGSYLPNDET
jgi:di/tricarboxylate transporter